LQYDKFWEKLRILKKINFLFRKILNTYISIFNNSLPCIHYLTSTIINLWILCLIPISTYFPSSHDFESNTRNTVLSLTTEQFILSKDSFKKSNIITVLYHIWKKFCNNSFYLISYNISVQISHYHNFLFCLYSFVFESESTHIIMK
jgi:hypothetical protein